MPACAGEYSQSKVHFNQMVQFQNHRGNMMESSSERGTEEYRLQPLSTINVMESTYAITRDTNIYITSNA